jgi:hypothetical protein
MCNQQHCAKFWHILLNKFKTSFLDKLNDQSTTRPIDTTTETNIISVSSVLTTCLSTTTPLAEIQQSGMSVCQLSYYLIIKYVKIQFHRDFYTAYGRTMAHII